MPKGYKKSSTALTREVAPTTGMYAGLLVGPDGGELHLPSAGLRISFPEGALEKEASISVSAFQDRLGFHLSMSPAQPLRKRVRLEQLVPSAHHGNTELAFGHLGADGEVDAFYAAKLEGSAAVAYVPEFSGYILASGDKCDPAVITDGSCVYVDGPT